MFIKGSEGTACPRYIKNKKTAKNIYKNTLYTGLNKLVCTRPKCIKGRNKRTSIALKRARTPKVLLGIDLNNA